MLENPWIKSSPTTKQARFLLLPQKEALYGGAAGGGKSEALLMAAVMYAECPDYSALMLRRTFKDLALPGALMDRANEWFHGAGPRWIDYEKTWKFPSGATLTFGYLESEADKFRYQSSEFQFIGFDELTQFTESQYTYLFSRLRRLANSSIPIRMRSGSNPGGIGHEWVKTRFIDNGKAFDRPFIPARLDENPFLDRESYIESLMNLDPVTRAQYLAGDWSARREGSKFKREWFRLVSDYPRNPQVQWVRRWDLAATEVKKSSKDPDWTAGALVGSCGDGIFYVRDIKRSRATPSGVEALVRQTALLDGREVKVRMEQEPGASGVNTISYYRKILPEFDFKGIRSTGSKEVRAGPFSSQCEAGNIKLVSGAWIEAFLDEAEVFPNGAHDDMLDATIGAFEDLVLIPELQEERTVIYDALSEVRLSI